MLAKQTNADLLAYCLKHADTSIEEVADIVHDELDYIRLSTEEIKRVLAKLSPGLSEDQYAKMTIEELEGTTHELAFMLRKCLLNCGKVECSLGYIEAVIGEVAGHPHKETFANLNWERRSNSRLLRFGYHFGRREIIFFKESKRSSVPYSEGEKTLFRGVLCLA